MSLLSVALALVGVVLSILALFLYQSVALLPGLGLGVLANARRIRIGVAAISIGAAGAAYLLTPTRPYAGILVLVVVLAPFAGFLNARRLFVPLDSPRHRPAADADLDDDASVVGVELDGHAHAWAVDSLIPHHVVNDEVGGRPVLAAWCAYCMSGIVYDATVDGGRLTFEPLTVRHRNMIMRDRETGTLWQHATGEALAGPLSGTTLEVLGGRLMTWAAWVRDHPETTVAEEPEESAWSGLLPRARTKRLAESTERVELPGTVAVDRRLPFTEEVVGVEVDGRAKAYPVATLRERGHVGDVLGGTTITVSFDPAADRAQVTSKGESVPFQRTRWMGWFEFHPETAIYEGRGG